MKIPAFEMPLDEIRASLDDAAPAAEHRRPARAQPVQRRRHHPRRAFVPGARDRAGRQRALLRARRDGDGPLREHRLRRRRGRADRARARRRRQAGRVREGRGPRRPVARRPARRVHDGVRQRGRPASPTRSSAPPTWSWASRCTASTTRSRSRSPPASPWPSGPAATTPADSDPLSRLRERVRVRASRLGSVRATRIASASTCGVCGSMS